MENNGSDSKPVIAPAPYGAGTEYELNLQKYSERKSELIKSSNTFKQLFTLNHIFIFAGIENFFEEDENKSQEFTRYSGPSPFVAAIVNNKEEIHLGAARILMDKVISEQISLAALEISFKGDSIKQAAINWINLAGASFMHDKEMGHTIIKGLEKAGILTIEQMWQAAGSDFYYFLEEHYADRKPKETSYHEERIGENSRPQATPAGRSKGRETSAKFQDPRGLSQAGALSRPVPQPPLRLAAQQEAAAAAAASRPVPQPPLRSAAQPEAAAAAAASRQAMRPLAPPLDADDEENKITVPRVSDEVSQAARLAGLRLPLSTAQAQAATQTQAPAQAASQPPLPPSRRRQSKIKETPDQNGEQPLESSGDSTAYFRALAEGDRETIECLKPFAEEEAPTRISLHGIPGENESAEQKTHLEVPVLKVKFFSGREIEIPLIELKGKNKFNIGTANENHAQVEDKRLNAEIECGPTGTHIRILQGGVALQAVAQEKTILNNWVKIANGEPLVLEKQGRSTFTDDEIEEIKVMEFERVAIEDVARNFTNRLLLQVKSWINNLSELGPQDPRVLRNAQIIDEFTKRAEKNDFLRLVDVGAIAELIMSGIKKTIEEWGQILAETAQYRQTAQEAANVYNCAESKKLMKMAISMHDFAEKREIPIGSYEEIKQMIAKAAEPYNERVRELKTAEEQEEKRKREEHEKSEAAIRQRKNEQLERVAEGFEDVHWDENDSGDKYTHFERGSVVIVEKIGHGALMMPAESASAQSIRPKALRPPVNTRNPDRQIFPVLLRRYTCGTHPSNTIQLPQILHGKRATRAFMFEIIYEPIDKIFKLKWLGGYLDMQTTREVMLEEECELSEYRKDEEGGERVRLNVEICGYNVRIETNHGFTHKFLERESEKMAKELIEVIEDQSFTSAEMDRDAVDGIRRLIELGYVDKIKWEARLKMAISGLWKRVQGWKQESPLADSSYLETLQAIEQDEKQEKLKEAAQKRLECYSGAYRESARESIIEKTAVKLPRPWQMAYYMPDNWFWSKKAMLAHVGRLQEEADKRYEEQKDAGEAAKGRYAIIGEKGIVEIAKFAQMGLLRESDLEEKFKDIPQYGAQIFKVRQLRNLFAQFERGVDPVPAAKSFLAIGAGKVMREVFTEDERNVFNRKHIDIELDGNAQIKEFLRRRVIILAKTLLKKARSNNDFNALYQLEGMLALKDEEGKPLIKAEELILQDLRDVHDIAPEIERLKAAAAEAKRAEEEKRKAEAEANAVKKRAEISVAQEKIATKTMEAEIEAEKEKQEQEVLRLRLETAETSMRGEIGRKRELIKKAKKVIDVIEETRRGICNLGELITVYEDVISNEVAQQMEGVPFFLDNKQFSWNDVMRNYKSLAVDKGRELALYAQEGVRAGEYVGTIREAVKKGVFELAELNLGADSEARLKLGIEKEKAANARLQMKEKYISRIGDLGTLWYDRSYLRILDGPFESEEESEVAREVVEEKAVSILKIALEELKKGGKINKAGRAVKAIVGKGYSLDKHFFGEELDLLQQALNDES